MKWIVKLGEFDIYYHQQPSIKAQALADFIIQCTLPEEVRVETKAVAPIPLGDVWMFYVDGASNTGASRLGMILANLDGIIAKQALRFNFKTSNDETEYEALLAWLRLT